MAKPQVFINLSGEVVAPLARRFHIESHDLLVICDDLDLPLGKIRIRQEGGHGGHKGMKSIISHMGSEGFPRIRVGIGRPKGDEAFAEEQVVNYVLSDFSPTERKIVHGAVDKVAQAIYSILTTGLTRAMNEYN